MLYLFGISILDAKLQKNVAIFGSGEILLRALHLFYYLDSLLS